MGTVYWMPYRCNLGRKAKRVASALAVAAGAVFAGRGAVPADGHAAVGILGATVIGSVGVVQLQLGKADTPSSRGVDRLQSSEVDGAAELEPVGVEQDIVTIQRSVWY